MSMVIDILMGRLKLHYYAACFMLFCAFYAESSKQRGALAPVPDIAGYPRKDHRAMNRHVGMSPLLLRRKDYSLSCLPYRGFVPNCPVVHYRSNEASLRNLPKTGLLSE